MWLDCLLWQNNCIQGSDVEIALDLHRKARLKAELAAIELWDNDHHLTSSHDKIDDDSFRARQIRRRELLDEIHFMDSEARAFRLRFVAN